MLFGEVRSRIGSRRSSKVKGSVRCGERSTYRSKEATDVVNGLPTGPTSFEGGEVSRRLGENGQNVFG